MSDLTNEQRAVSIAETLLEEHKPKLAVIFNELRQIASASSPQVEKENHYLALHQRAVAVFNFAEQAVANTALLGAHEKAEWRQNQAETCYDVLEHILLFYETLFILANEIAMDRRRFPTSRFAFGGLQRQVAQHLSHLAPEMREKFKALNLPDHGFDGPIADDSRSRTKITSEITDRGARLEIEGLESEHARDFLRGHKALRTEQGIAAGPFEADEMLKIAESLAADPEESQ